MVRRLVYSDAIMTRTVLAGLVLLLAGTIASAAQPPAPAPAPSGPKALDESAQRWKGTIELPQGQKLDIGVTLTPGRNGTPASGTLDIPLQGLKSGALSDVVLSADELKFTYVMAGAPAAANPAFTLKPSPDGKTATGELHQSGATMPVRLERIPEGAVADIGPKRPQEPKPPFPYTQREVSYTNAQDGTKLAATLTLPPGKGPFPAAVMITGSGPQDRDEALLGHKPFLVIADYLTRRGIAVLRADDRGVGGSTGNVADATAENSAGDALAGVALLKTIPEIDGAHIGLIGHSEGGIIGPMAAAESKDVAFVVMLAGTGLKGRDILTMQTEAMMLAAGEKKELVAAATERHRHLMDALEPGAPRAEIEKAMRELIRAQEEAGGAPPSSPAAVDKEVKQQMAALETKWFRSFLVSDPREALRKVQVPVLALNGALDTQVPAEANLREIEKALKEAGNTDVTTREMPGLNHLFQHAGTGSPSEYVQIEETFAPEALQLMGEWILARRGGK